MSDTLLLIGASGFVGGHLSRLAGESFEVIRAGRSGAADVACDLNRAEEVDRALRATRPAVVVNLAGAASVGRSLQDPFEAFATNTLGTVALMEAAERNAPDAYLLCISSGEVYGNPQRESLPATEESPMLPTNPYGTSKAALELVCGQHARSRGLAIAVARSFNHTGPGQSGAFAASAFARQIAAAEAEGAVELTLEVGDLAPIRDFTDVRDVAGAYLELAKRRLTGTYNVCSERPTRVGELVRILSARSAVAVETATSAGRLRPGEAAALYGSAAKLRDATGWKPAIPLEQTLEDLLDWWRERVKEGPWARSEL